MQRHEGGLRPVIEHMFDLDHVVDAYRRLESGRHGGGKIIVTIWTGGRVVSDGGSDLSAELVASDKLVTAGPGK